MNVLLIHGLGRSPLSMMPLMVPLQEAGHSVEFFGYWAFAESYDRIVDRLRQRLLRLVRSGDEYAIVGHSLGGLLTRSALAKKGIALPSHVFMLGTPNQSSRVAQLAWRWLPPFRWFARDCGKNLASLDWYATLEEPEFAYTAIAGTVGFTEEWSPFPQQINDGLVGVNEVTILDGDRPIQIPTVHTFLMNHPKVKQAIVDILGGY